MKPFFSIDRVKIMAVVNVSPESFYKGSVPATDAALARQIRDMEKDGAAFIDVGAMSSAPYLKTLVTEKEEARRLVAAVRVIRANTDLPISIDSFRSGPAEAGLEAGGKILNDITGLLGDPKLARVAKHAKGVILMAHPVGLKKIKAGPRPIDSVKKILQRSLQAAKRSDISSSKIAIDPGIGFFRDAKTEWWQWDLDVLFHLSELKTLKFPILAGVSRKSFIGKIMGGKKPEERLAGSLAATTIAVLNGASIIRTHDVKETIDSLRALKNGVPTTNRR